MNEQKKQNLSWIEAELEETLDDLFESEFNEPMLSDELRGLYKEKHPNMLDRRTYYTNLLRLQAELIKLQHWVELTGAKVLILCEGRDSAGKGGVIKRITQRLNPRVARVVALPAPTEREKNTVVFPTLCPALACGGGNRFVRPFVVQSRRCRTCNGICNRRRGRTVFSRCPRV